MSPLYRPDFHYHPGHSPLALSKWCVANWANTTNDYTAFDQSQTGEALALEQVMLLAFDVPHAVISYYLELKLNLCCQFGELAVMRCTGEGPTLLFHSTFNSALLGCQYSGIEKLPVAVLTRDGAIKEPRMVFAKFDDRPRQS